MQEKALQSTIKVLKRRIYYGQKEYLIERNQENIGCLWEKPLTQQLIQLAQQFDHHNQQVLLYFPSYIQQTQNLIKIRLEEDTFNIFINDEKMQDSSKLKVETRFQIIRQLERIFNPEDSIFQIRSSQIIKKKGRKSRKK